MPPLPAVHVACAGMPAHVADLANPPKSSKTVSQQRRSTIVWPRRRIVERYGRAAAFTRLAAPCNVAIVLEVTTLYQQPTNQLAWLAEPSS